MTFRKYVEDQHGAMTFWLLMWSIIFIAFAGLAIDVSNLYRTRAMLQATADSASHAGALALKNSASVTTAVSDVTSANMPSATTKGSLVIDTTNDVMIGSWDFASGTFTPGGTPSDAVMVVARRTENTSNSLDTFLLRILDFDTWNVSVPSVAVAVSRRPCDGDFPNALVSMGKINFTSNNTFGGVLCVHGEEGIDGKQNNLNVGEGVLFTMPYAEGPNNMWDVGECDRVPAIGEDPVGDCYKAAGDQIPWEAYPGTIGAMVDAVYRGTDIINATNKTFTPTNSADLTVADKFGFSAALTNDRFKKVTNGSGGNAYKASDFAADLAGHPGADGQPTLPKITHFRIDCTNPTNTFDIGSNLLMEDVVIVTDCDFKTAAGTRADNVTILSTSRSGTVERGDADTNYAKISEDNGTAITFVGQPANTNPSCGAVDSSLRLYTPGGISMTAQGQFSVLEAFAGGDIDFTAGTVTNTTVNLYAWGDIDWTANAAFTPCSPTPGVGNPSPIDTRRVKIVG